MAENKTKPTGASIDDYLDARANPAQREDCKALMALCHKITKQAPYMWGPSIVGYGTYTYTYESGRSGEAALAAFAIRGRELVVYLGVDEPGQAELLPQLGKHKMSKCCLYFKRLADLDLKILEALMRGSIAEVKRRYG